MSIEPANVILGRYRVEAGLPQQGELARWSAEDSLTGDLVEIVSPRPLAALRPGAREAFLAAHRRKPGNPAMLDSLATGEHDGRPVAVRPPVAEPWSPDRRLDPAVVEQLAAWLAPALVEAHAALCGRLGPDDLVVDQEGRPRLAPTGVVRTPSLATPDRYGAPEGAIDHRSALYGLGAVLFEALTGVPASPGRTTAQIARSQAAPPRPAEFVTGVPPRLDALVAALLSADPDERLAAARSVEQASPPLLPPTSLPAAPAEPPPRPLTPRRARADRALPPWVVVAHPARTTRGARRRLAALSGVPVAVLDQAARRGLPVPVADGPSEDIAQEVASRLGAAGADLQVARGAADAATGRAALAAAGALVFGLLATALLATGLGALAPLLLVLAALLGTVGGGLAAVSGARRRALRHGLQVANALIHEHADERPAPLRAASSAIDGARRALLAPSVPETLRVDLMTSLDELDDALDELASVPVLTDEARDEAERIADAATLVAEAATSPAGAPRSDVDSVRARARAAIAASRELG